MHHDQIYMDKSLARGHSDTLFSASYYKAYGRRYRPLHDAYVYHAYVCDYVPDFSPKSCCVEQMKRARFRGPMHMATNFKSDVFET